MPATSATQPRSGWSSPPVVATLRRRLTGGLVDLFVVAALAGALLTVALTVLPGLAVGRGIDPATGQVTGSAADPVLVTVLVTGAVQLTYHVVGIASWGRTLGGLVLGTAAARQADGTLPGWSAAVRRWLPVGGTWFAGTLAGVWLPGAAVGGSLLAAVVVLSPLTDRRGLRQGWQDRWARVLVVRC